MFPFELKYYVKLDLTQRDACNFSVLWWGWKQDGNRVGVDIFNMIIHAMHAYIQTKSYRDMARLASDRYHDHKGKNMVYGHAYT